jgi:hypothetical protein
MSPQMNGEPRNGTLSALDLPGAPINPPSGMQRDRPLLDAINTDGVAKTTIKEDPKLAPLFAPEATTDLRARWDSVQRNFVDDPGAAVHAADELVAQVVESLAETFASQRSELEGGHEHTTEESTTENLRLSFRRYRSFFERLLSI